MKNDSSSHSSRLVRLLNKINLNLRPKLILIFLTVKIIPIILLTIIAWNQIISLGHMLRDIAVNDSTIALNNGARENIERMATDMAAAVADFLSQRDYDVLLLASLRPSDEIYRVFSENKKSSLTKQGEWVLAEDGMSWVKKDRPVYDEPKKVSSNKENSDELFGSGFNYRAPNYFEHENVPLYDEITFIDLDGNEIYKYSNPGSPKRNYPLNPNKVNVSDKTNTYVRAETYFAELRSLKPGEIHVSEVIGAYVGTNYIGMYTPGVLMNVPETHPNYNLLREIARLPVEEFTEAAKKQAYAGKENPVGRRFEGIVRWATPVTDENGGITGYVTMALNHDHIMEFVDHVTPMIERYIELPSAYEGNYAFIWDYKCRSICHPRHHSIVGYNPKTGEPQVPWLEGTMAYERDYINGGFLKDKDGNKIPIFTGDTAVLAQDTPFYYWQVSGGGEWLDANLSWDDLSDKAAGLSWGEFLELYQEDRTILPQFGEGLLKDKAGNPVTDANGNYIIDYQSRDKDPATALTKAGFVGLDGRYLNNAPQCTGWMDLTEDGGSGSFYILWSGLYKPTTAGAIPYYTGQYAPEKQRGSKRGFAFVAIGAGIEDFTAPARDTEINLTTEINNRTINYALPLVLTSLFLFLIAILTGILMSSYLTGNISLLIDGISRFRSGEWQFRVQSDAKDEFGMLADSLNDMADSIVDSVKEPLSIINMDFKIIYMNDYALRITGKKLDEVLGVSYSEMSIYPSGSKYDPVSALFDGRDSEVFYQKESGHYYKGAANYFFGPNGRKIGYIIITNDVTEIEIARKKAELASRAKSNFLSNMSHEIRTPMNSIIGFTELAAGEGMSPKTKEYLNKIMDNSRVLLQIINDILDISKIESGHMVLEIIPFNLYELVANCQSIIYPKIVEKGIEMQLHIESSIRKKLFGDPLRLRQVLLNLLTNAVKFSEAGQVSLFVNLANLAEDTVTLCFEVSDSGIGMTQEQVTKILEPFTQADVSTTRRYGGTGLGLAIVANTLDLMDSRLKVESTLGVGTKCSFTVTFGVADETVETSEIISSEIQKPLFEGEILVFEDNIMNQQVVIEHLTKIGLKAEIAENGLVGVEKVKRRIDRGEKPYDLIFIDIHMPVMDGIEAASRIIESGSGTPIVAMTANVLTEDRELYKKLGMADYLGKPFTSQELWRCLLRHLRPVRFEVLEDNRDTLQNKLKADFAKANQNTFDEITKAIETGDISRAHRLVHTLKSNAGLIGRTELQKVAANIEIALKNGGASPSEAQISIFQYELNKTLNELMPLLNEAVNPAGPEIDAIDGKAALELFDKLEPLLSSGSPECLQLIDELRRIPDSGELIEQMEDFYFGDALKTLMELKYSTERHGEKHEG